MSSLKQANQLLEHAIEAASDPDINPFTGKPWTKPPTPSNAPAPALTPSAAAKKQILNLINSLKDRDELRCKPGRFSIHNNSYGSDKFIIVHDDMGTEDNPENPPSYGAATAEEIFDMLVYDGPYSEDEYVDLLSILKPIRRDPYVKKDLPQNVDIDTSRKNTSDQPGTSARPKRDPRTS